MKTKILIGASLILCGFVQYEFTAPLRVKPRDPVLEQVKIEYKNDCWYGETHSYKYYTCEDLKTFIEKREKQNELHK